MSAESEELQEPEELPEAGADEIVLADRYRILPGSPLPELDQPGAKAVTVRDQPNPGDMLFARICEGDAIPRISIMNELRNMREANLLRPLEWGPVDWPGSAERRFAVVFQRPEHPALMSSYRSKIKPLTSDDISRKLLTPIIATLEYLGQRGVTHRAIRPENIYLAGQSRDSVMLGDCVTALPALLQPGVFETIEMSMTPPDGRGPGLVCDDIYALGATVLILSMGECPVKDVSAEELIAAKISKGSYGALMGGRRPPFGLREVLRGMLSDDPLDRWGLEELDQWLGGSLRRSVQQHQHKGADRPFTFAGKEYVNCRMLAQAFGDKWEQSCVAMRAPEFEKWLRRYPEDPALADIIKGALQSDAEGESKTGGSGRLVSRICMILDVAGPIRYKGLNAMPGGIGTSLATAFLRKDQKEIQKIAECIGASVPLDWFASQSEAVQAAFDAEAMSMKQTQQFLRHSGPGYGVERILYELNPYLPCLSPVLCGKFVSRARNLLTSLEEVVRDSGSLPVLVDRHLAAFIASRLRGNIDRVLSDLEDRKGDSIAARLGMLTLFSRLQGEFGPESLPCLTEWLAGELEPALNRFKSRKRQQQLTQKLESAARGGDLVELSKVVNDDDMLRRDEGERKSAMRELSLAGRQIAALQSKEFQESTRRSGWQIAASISMCIAFAAMSVVVLW